MKISYKVIGTIVFQDHLTKYSLSLLMLSYSKEGRFCEWKRADWQMRPCFARMFYEVVFELISLEDVLARFEIKK